jgi:putative tricarboxylic transport membrane protein
MFWKKYGDYITSVFFIITSIAMITAAKALPKSKIMKLGPDFMPTVIGIVTLVLAIILLIQTVVRSKDRLAALAQEKPEECDYKKMLTSLVLILIYVFILKPVGFIISTLLYLLPQFAALAPADKRTRKNITEWAILDVVFTLVVFFLFRYGFTIVLPAGIFTISL